MKKRFLFLRKYRNLWDFERFKMAQANTIDTSKFIESQKAGRDLFLNQKGEPSQDFYLWWIKNHAHYFRDAWSISKCRQCSFVSLCKNCLKENCPDFIYDEEYDSSTLKRVKKTIINLGGRLCMMMTKPWPILKRVFQKRIMIRINFLDTIRKRMMRETCFWDQIRKK